MIHGERRCYQRGWRKEGHGEREREINFTIYLYGAQQCCGRQMAVLRAEKHRAATNNYGGRRRSRQKARSVIRSLARGAALAIASALKSVICDCDYRHLRVERA